MSARVNAVSRDFSPRSGICSIDEGFLDISDVRAWTGIPTCVGIGSTKKLAKLANHIAKRVPGLGRGRGSVPDPSATVSVERHRGGRISPSGR